MCYMPIFLLETPQMNHKIKAIKNTFNIFGRVKIKLFMYCTHWTAGSWLFPLLLDRLTRWLPPSPALNPYHLALNLRCPREKSDFPITLCPARGPEQHCSWPVMGVKNIWVAQPPLHPSGHSLTWTTDLKCYSQAASSWASQPGLSPLSPWPLPGRCSEALAAVSISPPGSWEPGI